MGPRGVGNPPHSSLPPSRPPDPSQFKLKLQAHKEEVAARFSKLGQSLTAFAAEQEKFQRQLREELRQLRLSYSNPPTTTVSTSPSSLITSNPSSPNYCQLPEPPPIPNCKPQPQIPDPTPPASFTLTQAVMTNPTPTHIVTATTLPQILPQIHHSPNAKPHKMKFKFGRVHRKVRIQSSKSRCRRKLDDSESDSYTGSGDSGSPESSPVRSSGKRKERKKIERDVSHGASLDVISVKAQKQSQTSGDSKTTWVNHRVKYRRCKSQKQILGRYYHNEYGPVKFVLKFVGLKIGEGHELENCFSGVDKRVRDKGDGHTFQLGNNPKMEREGNIIAALAFLVKYSVKYSSGCIKNGELEQSCKEFGYICDEWVKEVHHGAFDNYLNTLKGFVSFKMVPIYESLEGWLGSYFASMLTTIEQSEIFISKQESTLKQMDLLGLSTDVGMLIFIHANFTLFVSMMAHRNLELDALMNVLSSLRKCKKIRSYYSSSEDKVGGLLTGLHIIVPYFIYWNDSMLEEHDKGLTPYYLHCVANNIVIRSRRFKFIHNGVLLLLAMLFTNNGTLHQFREYNALALCILEKVYKSMFIEGAENMIIIRAQKIPQALFQGMMLCKNLDQDAIIPFSLMLANYCLEARYLSILITSMVSVGTGTTVHIFLDDWNLQLHQLGPHRVNTVKAYTATFSPVMNKNSIAVSGINSRAISTCSLVISNGAFEVILTSQDSLEKEDSNHAWLYFILKLSLIGSCLKEQQKIYKDWFNLVDSDGDGCINGNEGVKFFSMSKLSRPELKQVWAIADSKRQGLLEFTEFITAMQLIFVPPEHELSPDILKFGVDWENITPPVIEGLDAFIAKTKSSTTNGIAMNGITPNQPSSQWFALKSVKKLPLNVVTSIVDGLKRLYIEKLKSLEVAYHFSDFGNPLLTHSVFDAKPMVMLLSQYEVDCQLQGKDTLLALLKQNLHKAQERIKLFHDKRHTERTFEVGDLVYKKLQSYKQQSIEKRMVHKLLAKYYGPSEKIERIGTVAYMLKLPASARTHTAKIISTMLVRRKGQALAKWLIKGIGLLLKMILGSLLNTLCKVSRFLMFEDTAVVCCWLQLEVKLVLEEERVVRNQFHLN